MTIYLPLLQYATKPGPGGMEYVGGVRFLCGDPQCGSTIEPLPAEPPAPQLVPQPAPQPAPAPAAPPPAVPALIGAPNVSESAWFGPKKGPSDTGGLCPCGTFLEQFALYAGPSGAPAGLTGYCLRPQDGVRLELFPTPAGLTLSNGTASPTGFTTVSGTHGPQFIARCGRGRLRCCIVGWPAAGRLGLPAADPACLSKQASRGVASWSCPPLLPAAAWVVPAPQGPRPSATAAQQASRLSAST